MDQSISQALLALNQDITNARQKITEKGGTITPSGGSSQLATDIATIPMGVEEIATEAELDAKCIADNLGKIYKYIGSTTSKYIQGEYYKIVSNDVEIDLSQVGSDKLWRTSSVTVSGFDMSTVTGIWESNNYNINNSKAVAKILIHGQTNFSLYINSYGEKNYDYAIVSTVDAPTIPTSYSGENVKAHRRGNTSNPATSISNWTRVDFTAADGLDGGEHYVYVVYIKDSSTKDGNDRGYCMIVKTGCRADICTVPTGEKSITTNGVHDVGGYKTANVNVPNPSTGTKTITSNGTYDVTDFASADVQVSGGASGYKIYLYHKISVNDNAIMLINGNTELKLCQNMPDAESFFNGCCHALMSTVEKFKVYGCYHRGTYPTTSSSWARWRTHPSGEWHNISISSSAETSEEITLTADIDLEVHEGTCLNKGTLITMADGTKKPVEEIEVGDFVLGYDGKPLKVIRSQKGSMAFSDDRDVWTFENGYSVVTTYRHRFYNFEQQKMVYINEWKIGDHAITELGEKVALISHVHQDIPCHHFSLWCEEENYFAGGLLAGNRYTGEIKIE